VDDAYAIARVQVDGWRETYGGIIPQPVLDALSVDGQARQWRGWLSIPTTTAHVALEGERIVGFSAAGPAHDGAPPGSEAEIYAIYLDKDQHGKGIGRALFEVSREWTGWRSLVVWVLEKNPSRGFYERLGGVVVGHKQSEMGGATLDEVAYGWTAPQEASGRFGNVVGQDGRD
jgi:hypothetical protein